MQDKDILLLAGSSKSPLVCEFKLYNDVHLLDIRKYYTDKKTGELAPTRKGVSLTHVQYEVLAEMFQDKAEDIENRFSKNLTDLSINAQSLEASRDASDNCSVHIANLKGSDMTRYEQKGGVSKLELNQEHPWILRLLELTSRDMDDELLAHIILLFKAYHQAQSFLDPRNTNALEVVDAIDANWARHSKSLVKDRDYDA